MLRALRVAEQAEAWLSQLSEGRVHSTFAKACNLSWGDRLLSLVLPEHGMVPGGATVALTRDEGWGFAPGEAVHWDASRRRLEGSRTTVDLSGAARWTGRGPAAAVAPAPVLGQRTAVMAGVVHEGGRGELAQILSHLPPRFPAERDPGRWSSFAWAPMESLLRALAAGESATAAAALVPLVGLGEGLTPSCDDFLLGILAVLHYGQAALTGPQAVCGGVVAAETVRLSAGSTPVSANYLRLAAEGGFSERLEAAVLALVSPSEDDMLPAARALMDTGHSSGTDSLVGVILGATFILLGENS